MRLLDGGYKRYRTEVLRFLNGAATGNGNGNVAQNKALAALEEAVAAEAKTALAGVVAAANEEADVSGSRKRDGRRRGNGREGGGAGGAGAAVAVADVVPGPHSPGVFEYRMLSGLTGVGKTDLLMKLREAGEQVLDLEGLANHRGSLLGGAGMPAQPTQKMWESMIVAELRSFDTRRPGEFKRGGEESRGMEGGRERGRERDGGRGGGERERERESSADHESTTILEYHTAPPRHHCRTDAPPPTSHHSPLTTSHHSPSATYLLPPASVFIESESSKVGNRSVPPALWLAMKSAGRYEVQVPVAVRVQRILADYDYWINNPEDLKGMLQKLKSSKCMCQCECGVSKCECECGASVAHASVARVWRECGASVA